MMVILKHGSAAVCAGYWFCAVTGTGLWCVDRLCPGRNSRDRLLWGGLLGIMICGLLLLLLAALQLLQPVVLGGVMAVGIVPAVYGCSRLCRRARRPGGLFPLLTVLTAAWLCVSALTPPVSYDNLVYHLAVPAAYLKAGGLVALPNLFHSSFPLLGSLVSLPLQALAPWAAVTVWGTLAALFFPLALGNCLRPLVTPRWRWCWYWLVCTTPLFAYLATALIYDLLAASFALAALDLLRRGTCQSLRGWALAGLLAGGAVAVKYSAALYLGPLLLVAVLLSLRIRPAARRLSQLALFAASVMVPVVPWLLRNYVFTGNGLAPFTIAGPPSAAEAKFMAVAKVSASWLAYPAWWRDLLALRLDPLTGLTLPVLLGAAVLLAWRWRGRGRGWMTTLLGYGLATQLLWYGAAGRNIRFVFPALLLLAGGLFVLSVRRLPRQMRPVGMLVLLIIGALNLGILQQTFPWFMRMAACGIGIDDENSYLRTAMLNSYVAAATAVNDRPGDAHVLFVGECRTLYCDKGVVGGTVYDRDVLTELVAGSVTQEGLTRKLQELGIGFILYNRAEAARLQLGPAYSPRLAVGKREWFRQFAEERLELLFAENEVFVFALKQEA